MKAFVISFSPLELQILSLIDRWRHQRDHRLISCNVNERCHVVSYLSILYMCDEWWTPIQTNYIAHFGGYKPVSATAIAVTASYDFNRTMLFFSRYSEYGMTQ